MHEAMFYSKDNNYVYCLLCPHYCKLRHGQRGRCKVRINRDGRLYAENYEKVTSYHFDPIEKKPLYHFYPGSTIFSFGSFGCNFSCDFCQNWEIVENRNNYLTISKGDILSLSKASSSIGIAYTYNEPTVNYEFMYDTMRMVRDEDNLNVMVTNGFINREPLLKLLPYVDGINIDLKSYSENFYKQLCNGSLEPVKNTIRLSSLYTHVEVTTLVIDGKNSSDEEMEEISSFIAGINPDIPLHLSRYYPQYKMSDPATELDTLIRLRNIASKNLNHVYVGNVWGVFNDTICPNCKSALIKRQLSTEVVGIEDGRCTNCGYHVYGRF